ncbi:NHL repeat-containing protein [Trematosphaeria pertusa]|uniref:NHL repeat-containing protein n=1 Tax=Trematosphaeria pertusa TaxID=390896 RepID=A0A6A6J4R3_9PLEO|nr:NHL repeat-containing protein [Trematosphaeria pertusa]KAF2257357.1 NHL repeat-containing protein [Trematosphaeria pertusa]
MRLSSVLVQVLSLTGLASAVALGKRQSTTQVYKFSSPKSAEGIAARSNGNLLVSFFDKGEMWEIDTAKKTAAKIATFTDTTCSAAIAEVAPDVFAVVAGQYAQAGGNKPGSWGIWKVDFTSGSPVTSLLKKVPESGFWNGLTAFSNDTILIGDASKGAVWRMNINTGEYSIAIQDASMAPSSGMPMGIDGVRYANGSIYYTNIFANRLYKVAVDSTGKATGTPTAIWTNQMADDMAVGPDGSVYVAASNGIKKVTSSGEVSNAVTVQSATSCTFGKTEADKNTLYIAGSNGVISSVKV